MQNFNYWRIKVKKNLFVLFSTLMLLNFLSCDKTSEIDNSRDSLDWGGIYTGIIPGADSAGINVQITLNYDETYKISYHYIDKSDEIFIQTGTFKWNKKGSTITCDTKDIPPHYKVVENALIQLDMKGKAIEGELANNYVLKKQQ